MARYNCDDTTIWFKSNKGNGYAWLSNFWPDVSPAAQKAVTEDAATTPFVINGRTFRSVEHYFHACKYDCDNQVFEDIRGQPTAVEAKKRNTHYKKRCPIDVAAWNERRNSVMKTALTAKFCQNPVLKQALLHTGARRLREVPGRGSDGYWHGKGDNQLGVLLEEVRAELQQ